VILEGAVQAFARGDASMADIAEEAGVARATVYRHFPSREALLERLLERTGETAAERLDAERIDAVPVEDAIRRTIRVLVDLGNQVVLLNNVWHRRPGGSRVVVSRVCGLIERGQKTGVIRAEVPAEWLADALVGSVAAVMASQIRHGREDTVDHLTRVFLHGAAAAD
jgi:TetR/AcrR family transcriptional regulator, mexCD-oprJ operon repressor